jgi:hypothetical protein
MADLKDFISQHKPEVSKNTWRLLVGLLVADVWFMVMYIVFAFTGFTDDRNFRISHEGSYAEQIQYVKWLLSTVLTLYLAWRYQAWLYLAWAVLFGYLFLDDMLMIHEIVGELIGSWFPFAPTFSLRPQDFGEMTVFAVSGMVLFALVGLFYRWSQDAPARQASRFLVKAVLLLAFFGIILDALHSLISSQTTSRMLNVILTILEDGGEHVLLTVVVVYVFMLVETAFYSERRVSESAPASVLR